ncbi:MAG: DUF2231 domain-containing protein [Myxococcales bacterium]|nr:DUF2231 domain-containing protein [Myxococcales bacterium]
MAIRLHELHPILVHAPLSALPAAAICDLAAVARRDRLLARLGSKLWMVGAGGALLAGVAGMAASQEVRTAGKRSKDVMFLHGIGNLALALCALGLTFWRQRHRPTAASAAVGVASTLAAAYTGYLGGELVYDYAVGVKAGELVISREESPPLFSGQAARKLFSDAALGAAWLFRELFRFASGMEKLAKGAPAARPFAVPPARERPLPEHPLTH